MIQLTVTDVSDGAYGAPASTRTVTGLDVVTGGYTSDDLANAGNTGLCQTCHATSGGASYYTRSLFTPLASHNGANTTLCTACHTHLKDFAAESCESCHDSTPYVKGTATAPNVMGDGERRWHRGVRLAVRQRRPTGSTSTATAATLTPPGCRTATRSTWPAPPATT